MTDINYLELFVNGSYNTDITEAEVLALALAKIIKLLTKEATA